MIQLWETLCHSRGYWLLTYRRRGLALGLRVVNEGFPGSGGKRGPGALLRRVRADRLTT
jgi:hypothetical protein